MWLEVPLILFLTIVAPIWIIAHYVTSWRMANTLSPEDEKQLGELWQIAERMEERVDTIERILDAEMPAEDPPVRRTRPDDARQYQETGR